VGATKGVSAFGNWRSQGAESGSMGFIEISRVNGSTERSEGGTIDGTSTSAGTNNDQRLKAKTTGSTSILTVTIIRTHDTIRRCIRS
jgi:hypothetical protein